MKGRALFLLFVLSLSHLYAQVEKAEPAAESGRQAGRGSPPEPTSLVGLTLDELIRCFGAPRSVYAARGLQQWQDDVVFVYEQGDFYIYKDRVWQIGLKAARGIKIGDSRSKVALVLGSEAQERENSLFYPLDEPAAESTAIGAKVPQGSPPAGSWPLVLRCDFDRAGAVLAIFIYRLDF